MQDSVYDRPMTKSMTPDEERTKAWLEARGYRTEYEPDFIPEGQQRPDFWAESKHGDPAKLWVEVKQIDEDDSGKATGVASKVKSGFTMPIGLHGVASMAVHEAVQEQSVQAVLKLYDKHAPKYANGKSTLAFVQDKAGATVVRRAEVSSREGVKRLWVRGVATGPLACPHNFCGDEPFAETKYWDENGQEKTAPAHDVLDWSTGVQCALTVRLDPAGRPIKGFAIHSVGSTNTRERTINALEKANKQIKSAIALREAPAIVMLVPKYDYVDDGMIKAGCYGVLTAQLNVETKSVSALYHGADGVFRPTKNRHISAAIRLWQNGEATYFVNPYAHHKIDERAKLLKGLHKPGAPPRPFLHRVLASFMSFVTGTMRALTCAKPSVRPN
jgi:hypothetical protein